MIDISVIIPTYDRCQSLRECLLALSDQQLIDMTKVEIIVVENGPKAGVSELIESLRCHFESLRYFYNAELGVSRARNVGLKNARGQILVFVDDDEIPRPQWLFELVRPFSWAEEKADIVCGECEPLWLVKRPDWLVDQILSSYSVRAEWAPEVSEMKPTQWVFEGNCAVRTELLREAGGFSTELGRVGTSLLSGEGVVFSRLRSEGAVAIFNPKALVAHQIFAEQLTVEWLFRRWFAQGREDAMNHGDNPAWIKRLSGASLRLDVFASQNFEDLSPDQVLAGVQLYRALGFMCQRQRVL